MKVLRRLDHYGKVFEPGAQLNVSVVSDQEFQAETDKIVGGRSHTEFPVINSELDPLKAIMSQSTHDRLVAAGVISDDDNAALPKDGSRGAEELMVQNYLIQERDTREEQQSKIEQAANRAANVADSVAPPAPAPSQVIQGNAADAEAAIAKANQAAVQTAPAPVAAGNAQ